MDVTISAFRACVGGYVGGGHVHPALLDAAREALAQAKESGLVTDGFVARCGDDIDVVLLGVADERSADARSVARDVLAHAASAGARLRQHGGNGGVELDGAGLRFALRPSEPVLCLFTNKVRPGAWNLHLFRMFADPFITAGLVTDPALSEGFRFAASAPAGGEETFDLPADFYRLLAALRAGSHLTEVRSRASGDIAAVASIGPDPVLVVRCEPPFPAVEDALEAFAMQRALGAMPLVPVSANGDATARSIPRAVGLGFQVGPDRLVGPRDLLGDAAFDDLRREAVAAARSARSASVIHASDGVPSPI